MSRGLFLALLCLGFSGCAHYRSGDEALSSYSKGFVDGIKAAGSGATVVVLPGEI